MVKECETAGNAAHGLWSHLGTRICNRRVQLGLSEGVVAAHLGVPLERYREFEAGRTLIPAALLSYVGDLFKVPLFYFFQDLPFGEEDIEPSRLDEPPVLVVATTEDRLDALVRDFLKADQEGQSYLLLLARAFAKHEDAKR
jgi:transcriptional regulator with XRE-family HTH domain